MTKLCYSSVESYESDGGFIYSGVKYTGRGWAELCHDYQYFIDISLNTL